jgi:hypothetical protein
MTPSWDKYRGRISAGDRAIEPGSAGRKIMAVLAERPGQDVPRAELAELTGQTLRDVRDAVRSLARMLRAAFGDDAALVATDDTVRWAGEVKHQRPLSYVATVMPGKGAPPLPFDEAVRRLATKGYSEQWRGSSGATQVALWTDPAGRWHLLARMPDDSAGLMGGGDAGDTRPPAP